MRLYRFLQITEFCLVHAPHSVSSNANSGNDTTNRNPIVSFLLKEPAPISTIYASPNPTFNGQTSIYISDPSNYSEIAVCDLLGREILTISNPQAVNKINISTNPRGVYIVKVKGNKSVYVTKIIYE